MIRIVSRNWKKKPQFTWSATKPLETIWPDPAGNEEIYPRRRKKDFSPEHPCADATYLQLKDIQMTFTACVADGASRSVEALLRIADQQLDFREKEHTTLILIAAALLTLHRAMFYFVLRGELVREWLTLVGLGLVLLVVSFHPSFRRLREKLNPKDETIPDIETMLCESLSQILQARPDVTFKLNRRSRYLVKRLGKNHPDFTETAVRILNNAIST